MIEQAQAKVRKFVKGVSHEHNDHFALDFNFNPPLMIYRKDDNFVALDPANNTFWIDEGLNFPFELDMNTDPEIVTRLDRVGKAVLDKSRNDFLSQWLENTTL